MPSEPRRLVILAQHSAAQDLPAHVRIHLQRLRPLAERLVLVSNSPLPAGDLARAEAICDEVILRDNLGWDFAGWRDALAGRRMENWDRVVLTNSSVVGPLFPLAPIFARMERRGGHFWGMVRSRHIAPHLQSYFLSFGAEAIRSSAWRGFWAGVEDLRDKKAVIRRYEVGLSRTLRRAGFCDDALIGNPRFPASIRMVNLERLKGRLRVPMSVNYVNRTVELHRELILQGMPYLKASLLWGKDVYRRRPMAEIKGVAGLDYPWSEIGF